MTEDPPAAPGTLQALAAGLAGGGDREAVARYDDETEAWSYARLGETVARLARGLAARGVGAGSVVAVAGEGAPAWIVAALAVLRRGATLAPLDSQMAPETFRHVLEDSGAGLLFAAAAAEGLGDAGIEIIRLDTEEWRDLLDAPEADHPEASPGDRAMLFYTSGTTGPPKGAPLTHANLAFQIRTLAEADLVGRDERVLLPLPPHHVYPFVIGLLTPLALRCTVVLPGGFTGARILAALRDGRATMMIGVPRLYEALLDGVDQRLHRLGRLPALAARGAIAVSGALRRRLGWRLGRRLLAPLHRRLGPRLATLVSGGAALKPETGDRLEDLGWTVGTGYGLTETAPLVAFDRPGEARFDTAGRPVPGIEIRIDRGPDGDADTPGEIQVRGPGVFAGYHGLPDETAAAFTADGWYRTGDLGRLDADGRLRLGGRRSTVIVTESGKNVQPDAIEDAYAAHPAIGEIAVLGRDGRLAGLIVPAAGIARDATDARVREAVAAVSARLPSYQRLSEYAVTPDAIPRTRLGKPRRHLLAERYDQARGGGESRAARPVPPDQMSADDRGLVETPAGAAAWDLLAERFADHRLAPDSDLRLDLGIDSIAWLDLTLALSERTGVTLSEEAVGEMDTVRDLLTALAEGGGGAAVTSPLDDPEGSLDADQRHWLTPPGPVARAVGRLLHALDRLVLRLLFRLEVRGDPPHPADGPVVLAPNHASYLDPFALAAALDHGLLRDTCWAGWTGVVFISPLHRVFARICRVLPVDDRHAIASSLAFGAATLKRGTSLIWFPEGMRSPDGALQPFKAGIGLLLERHPATVVPVAIRGTWDAWPPDRTLPRPRRVSVTFLPARSSAALAESGAGDSAARRIVDALQRDVAEALDDGRPA